MKIKILYFAHLREKMGKDSEIMEEKEGLCAGDILVRLFADKEERKRAVAYLGVAVNNEYSDMKTPLVDGDEVAFIPPTAGG